jgi:RND family efflux transporter MFP subunit
MNFSSQSGRMRLGQVVLTLTAAVLMFVAFAFFRAPDDAVEAERPGTTMPRVVVSEVGMQPFTLSVGVVGRVSPWREVALAAEVSGRVDEIHVDIGDHVAAGDLLVSIETDNYETALREAEASQLRAEARLEESEAALHRMDALRKRGAISDREHEAALATKRAAEADVGSAEAGLERAHNNLDDTSVTAPFAGTIVERHADPGTLVVGDRALLTLADLHTVAIEVGLTEREIFRALGARSAFVQSTSRAGLEAQGTIDGIAERADPSTGTYLVRIRVANDGEQRFLGGMVVNVDIPYAELDAIPTVPVAAVLMLDRDPHVFVVRDGRVVRVDLEVLARQDDRLGVVVRSQTPQSNGDNGKVSAALQLGDLVVVVGQTQLADGAAVEIATRR